jgi:hypothetical protein
MVYVYAITDSPELPPGEQPGLAEEPLEILPQETLCAVYSRHEPGSSLSPTAENVWRHEQVVERLMSDRAVLPARFGTRFDHPENLAAVLARHGRELSAGLRRVAGCVELDERPPRVKGTGRRSGTIP